MRQEVSFYHKLSAKNPAHCLEISSEKWNFVWQESLHERGQADHAAECRALFAYQRRRKQDRWQFLAFPLLPFFPSLCASRVKSSAAGAAWRQLSRQQRCRFDGSLLCCAISCTFATPCNHELLHCTFVLFAKNPILQFVSHCSAFCKHLRVQCWSLAYENLCNTLFCYFWQSYTLQLSSGYRLGIVVELSPSHCSR